MCVKSINKMMNINNEILQEASKRANKKTAAEAEYEELKFFIEWKKETKKRTKKNYYKIKKNMPPLCFCTIDIAYCTVHFLFKMKLINYLCHSTKLKKPKEEAEEEKELLKSSKLNESNHKQLQLKNEENI